MGKLNEIQQQTTMSYGNNSFTTTIEDNTVKFDSARDSFTFVDPVNVPSINIGGTSSAVFTEEEKTKLSQITTPMQVKGRVDSAEDLPTEDVSVGDTYLVGLSSSETFDEYVCVELSGSPEAPVWESVGTTQVQADWNQTNTSAVDYIKNKPTIPSAQVQADWDQSNESSADYIKNKPFYQSISRLWSDTEIKTDASASAYIVINTDEPSLTLNDSFDLTAVDQTITVTISEYSVAADCKSGSALIGFSIEGEQYQQGGGNLTISYNSGTNKYVYTISLNGNPQFLANKEFYAYANNLKKLNNVFLDIPADKGSGSNSIIMNNLSNTGGNTATGDYAVAEGSRTTASGNYGSHAEGNRTTASGQSSHAEGYSTTASSQQSHAEGYSTTAGGIGSHAEGAFTEATGSRSHAEGQSSTASGSYSHAEGYTTIANHRSQHVFGEYNVEDPSASTASNKGNYVEIVGNGTGVSARSNARTLDWDGNEVLSGTLTTTGVSTKKLTISSIDPADVFMHSEIFDASSDVASSRVVANADTDKTDGYVEILYKASSGVTCSAYIDSTDVALTADGAWHKLEQGCNPAAGVEIHINNPSPVTDATMEVISKVYYI